MKKTTETLGLTVIRNESLINCQLTVSGACKRQQRENFLALLPFDFQSTARTVKTPSRQEKSAVPPCFSARVAMLYAPSPCPARRLTGMPFSNVTCPVQAFVTCTTSLPSTSPQRSFTHGSAVYAAAAAAFSSAFASSTQRSSARSASSVSGTSAAAEIGTPCFFAFPTQDETTRFTCSLRQY